MTRIEWVRTVPYLASKLLPASVELISDDGLSVFRVDHKDWLYVALRNKDTRVIREYGFPPDMSAGDFSRALSAWGEDMASAEA